MLQIISEVSRIHSHINLLLRTKLYSLFSPEMGYALDWVTLCRRQRLSRSLWTTQITPRSVSCFGYVRGRWVRNVKHEAYTEMGGIARGLGLGHMTSLAGEGGGGAVLEEFINQTTIKNILPDQSWRASITSDSLFSFPTSSISRRGRKPSAATGLSPAEDSGGKRTHQGAQEVPLQLQQVCIVCV